MKEFTLTEKLAIEAVAIGMFESFLRQQATENRGRSIQDWKDLDKDSRVYWREAALFMTKEID